MMIWSLIFSAIVIVFYYIICKTLVYIDCEGVRKPFTLLHFLLSSLISLIPFLNILEFCTIIVTLIMAAINDDIGIKNSNNKIIKFLNKEV